MFHAGVQVAGAAEYAANMALTNEGLFSLSRPILVYMDIPMGKTNGSDESQCSLVYRP
jgi:hypothetical protein